MKLFREVNTQSDGQLQNDVDAIVYWANHWQMQFNAGKCKVVHYGKNSCLQRLQVQYVWSTTQRSEDRETFGNCLF